MKNLAKLYRESPKGGLNWYREARQWATDTATATGYPLEVVVGVLAALSPGTNWDRNKFEAERLLRINKGENVPKFMFTTYGANVIKAEQIALGTLAPFDAFKEHTGPKTYYFFRCILFPDSPEYVCIDRHAYTIATGDTYKGLTPKQYRLVADHYKRAAKRLNVMPSQLQAVLWVDYRNKLTKTLDKEIPF